MSNQKLRWQGASNKTYEFEVFGINTNFNSDAEGNYIFAKQTLSGWDAVYIGEGNIQNRTHDEAHRNCAIKKGATHIHAHANSNSNARKLEESDLLAYNTEAYEPLGCNKKTGG